MQRRIILYAHTDVVRNDITLRFEDGKLIGLLDDYIGQFIILSVLGNESVRELERQGRIKYFFGQHEEFGLSHDFPTLDPKRDIVINVDVCAGRRYKNVDIGLENTYKFPTFAIEGLKWEGYKFNTFKWTGDPDEADAMDQFAERKIPGCSFIVPIECPNDNWHGEATIEWTKVLKAIQILTRLICYLS
jgi:hypothetical protein